MKVDRKAWIKFAIVAILYILWTIWVGCYWLLLLLPVLFDIYISKRVHWAFWKKKGVKKQPVVIEWIDALIFAVVAATLIRIFFFEAYTIPTSSMEKSMLVGDYLFVSKVAYGPKLPNTPLALPFVHHSLPNGSKAYSEALKWPYKRIGGLSEIERNDVMVFNFPAGDTIVQGIENPDYYSQLRSNARMYRDQSMQRGDTITEQEAIFMTRKLMNDNFTIFTRPVDKRENYIKRGVGMPGDTLVSEHGVLYVNGKKAEVPAELQFVYRVYTNGTPMNRLKLQELGIANDDMAQGGRDLYILPLTTAMVDKLKQFPNVVKIEKTEEVGYNPDIFPFNAQYEWNVDNFGPLYVPAKGATVDLNTQTLPFYERIIENYEGNKLEIKGDEIFINGEKTDKYTFKMDYYWMMGDNRHMSADSRYWGFVPEDHVVGKASFIWLSLDKDQSFPKNIRWNRVFKKVQ
ncbi:MAG: S26 family signal peptidase [Marinifilaceae bacterium]